MSKQIDIWQRIKKYLNGELDSKAMHQLEKEAQQDSFLADALEGYEKVGIDQAENIQAINKRLHERIAPHPVRRMVIWRNLTVAATMIGVLVVAGLLLTRKPHVVNEKHAQVAMTDKTMVNKPDTHTVKQTKRKNNEGLLAEVTTPKKEVITIKKPGVNFNRPATTEHQNIAIDDKSDDTNAISLDEEIAVGYAAVAKSGNAIKEAQNMPSPLAGRAPGMAAMKSSKVMTERDERTITGKIVDTQGPLPGASVRIAGTDVRTITDLNGIFRLRNQPDDVVLDVNMIGYLNKQVKVSPRDSMVIAMQPNNQALSEVVVVNEPVKVIAAHPENGWDEFNKYLKVNAHTPDGKTGAVKLSFIIKSDGALSDFKIIKSLSEQTNQKAIDLVKNGAKWVANSSGRSELITLTVKFTN